MDAGGDAVRIYFAIVAKFLLRSLGDKTVGNTQALDLHGGVAPRLFINSLRTSRRRPFANGTV